MYNYETYMQIKRPPVVVIMGSVDHGKTTLLDYIRKTNVAAKEAGGITQSTGAYEITHKNEKITFIDTPGHAVFSKMRERGAKAADIAVIVVAVDDSVQLQTKEAIKIATESKTPFVVAINKVDKNNTDLDRVKNDLLQSGVLLEGYGGSVSFQPISAKTGEGVNELLDLILLTAEVEDLKYDPDAEAEGFILESKLDNRRGISASAILKNGTLRSGDNIVASHAFGRIKILESFLGKVIKEASPSSPVLIFGFEDLPKTGDTFRAGSKISAASATEVIKKSIVAKTKEEKSLAVILKADTSGSLEALADIIRSLPAKNKKIEIIEESVGEISDGDVKLAISTNAIIVGFHTKTDRAAEGLARANNIRILESDIVYELVKALEEFSVADMKPSGKLEILAVFGKKGGKQIIGGKVIDGEIKNNSVLEVERNKGIIDRGRVINLQQAKKDVAKVEMGNECGLLFDAKTEIKVGDVLMGPNQ